MPTKRPLEERFWEKVDKHGSCWEWTAACNPKGYGQISVGRVMRAAHRVSWELNCGEIPEGQSVLHRCDNRRCINPDHLFLGTQCDNVHDMINKGRRHLLVGSKNGSAKLCEKDIKKIRLLVHQGHKQNSIADQFGVTKGHVSNIVHRRVWNHLV